VKNFSASVRAGIALLALLAIALITATPVASQTAIARVAVTSVNANDDFPDVSVLVRALDAEGAFIPGISASQFSLREDGETLQIQEVRTEALPLNARVVFVVDELGIARHIADVREAIQSFAQNQMQAGDLVEVLAALNGGGTRAIVPLTGDPEEVITGMANYNPSSASGTLLLDTVDQGLDDLAALSENTEGLNTTVVFSVSINDQLDLDETIAKAVELRIPVHTVLLGADDINGALGQLARETGAGGGTISPDDVENLFETLVDQSVQDQYLITYRSKVDRAGDHELVVSISGVSSNDVTFALDELEPPLVRITAPAPDTLITRAESLFTQNTEDVQPTEQTVAVEVNWRDGHPREIVLETTALVVNGKSLGPATAIRDNGRDPVLLEFTWDLRGEDTPGETQITVVVEAVDELGLKGVSEPLSVTVSYVPFEGAGDCPQLISDYAPVLCSNYNLILPLGSLVIAVLTLLVVVVYLRRNPKVQQKVKERLGTMMTDMRGPRTGGGSPGATSIVQPVESAKATLEIVAGKSGTDRLVFPLNETVTLGRSSDHAQLVFQSNRENSPISRLHCTILEKGDFFELRDEGSANGTFLNGVRLKSGDLHRLGNGDTIELARAQDGGVKFKFQAVSRASHMGTQMVEPKAKESDDLPKDGYIPTKIQDTGKDTDQLPKDGYTPTRMKDSEQKDDDLPKDGYTPTKMK
jgi:pSer/pThr/pTyr-binding forkhead associated (FHA) protein